MSETAKSILAPFQDRATTPPKPRKAAKKTKKADVAEHLAAFDHVGLLVNEPPRAMGLLFI